MGQTGQLAPMTKQPLPLLLQLQNQQLLCFAPSAAGGLRTEVLVQKAGRDAICLLETLDTFHPRQTDKPTKPGKKSAA